MLLLVLPPLGGRLARLAALPSLPFLLLSLSLSGGWRFASLRFASLRFAALRLAQ